MANDIVDVMARGINRGQCESDTDAARCWTYENVRHNRMLDARAALSALDAAGYVVAPREPTQAMTEAGGEKYFLADGYKASQVYTAMLSAVRKGE